MVSFNHKFSFFFFISERITYSSVRWSGPYNITRIEAFDQSDGSGGEVAYYINGIGQRNVILLIFELLPHSGIDFIIKIYGERLPPNDVFFGNLTEQSVLLHTLV